MTLRLWSIALVALALAGCGGEGYNGSAPAPTPQGSASAPGAPGTEASAGEASGAGTSATSSSVILAAASVPRKIIYTAEVEMTVEDLNGSGKKLLALVQRHRGYVASTEVGGAPGAPRRGVWKLRVPVGEFDTFRSDLEALGAVQTSHLDSQDVTEEYYDVAGHITNKQVEEKRLLDHLRHSTGTLTDILSVERELSRVRGEIEQLQGRLRLLANQTALTTITVTLQEVREFVPTRGTSFLAEVNSVLQGSLGNMREMMKVLVLAAVALAPWALLLGIIAAPLIVLGRRQGAFKRLWPQPESADEPRV